MSHSAKEMLGWAQKKLPADCQVEIYFSQGRGRSISWSEKKCEDLQEAGSAGVGVRVIQKNASAGRQGFSFSNVLDRVSVEKAAEDAFAFAKQMPWDEYRALLDQNAQWKIPQINNLEDPQIFADSIPAILDKLQAQEAALLKRYPLLKSVLRAGLSLGTARTQIATTAGINESFGGTYASLGVGCLVEKNGERQEGGFGQSSRFASQLNWDSIFDRGAQRAIALLDGKPVAGGKIPVVFDPSVGCEFLSLLAGAVCADQTQKGKSPFAQKLGQKIASDLVNVVDDGVLEGGLASAPIDDEGHPAQTTSVIEGGVLRQFLYDSYTARKAGVQSTGNASRAGFKSAPSTSTSNFYLKPGKLERQKLLNETTGLYLYDVMGLHMADPISGDFSLAVMGAWLNRGEFVHGVRGVTLAGNIPELLQNIDAVASDLEFHGSIASPTFRAQNLTLSGVAS